MEWSWNIRAMSSTAVSQRREQCGPMQNFRELPLPELEIFWPRDDQMRSAIDIGHRLFLTSVGIPAKSYFSR